MTIVIRCTAKLLKLVASSPTTRSMDPHPTDWYGNLLWLDGRRCMLLSQASTLFAAFEPDITKAQVTPLGKLATPLIERELEAEGLPLAELVCEALQMAITRRRPRPGLIFHSDRGSQYTSKLFRGLLESHGIRQSLARPGQCWDNAVIEAFWSTLKVELVQWHSWLGRLSSSGLRASTTSSGCTHRWDTGRPPLMRPRSLGALPERERHEPKRGHCQNVMVRQRSVVSK